MRLNEDKMSHDGSEKPLPPKLKQLAGLSPVARSMTAFPSNSKVAQPSTSAGARNNWRTIVERLGPHVLLLPIRRGTKKPTGKWRHLTIADMANTKHLAKLNRASNIGVALGEVSNHLCSIDIDDDAQVEPFLELNPFLKDTLCSKGKRGCNYWVRLVGDYPGTHQIKVGRKNIGEFRANGAYTVIHGTHPEEMTYRIINEAAPIEIAYDSIKWFEKSKHTSPPTTSSLSLNTKYSILHPISSILYDKGTPPSPLNPASVLERIQARKAAEASFKREHYKLVDVCIAPSLKAASELLLAAETRSW